MASRFSMMANPRSEDVSTSWAELPKRYFASFSLLRGAASREAAMAVSLVLV